MGPYVGTIDESITGEVPNNLKQYQICNNVSLTFLLSILEAGDGVKKIQKL